MKIKVEDQKRTIGIVVGSVLLGGILSAALFFIVGGFGVVFGIAVGLVSGVAAYGRRV